MAYLLHNVFYTMKHLLIIPYKEIVTIYNERDIHIRRTWDGVRNIRFSNTGNITKIEIQSGGSLLWSFKNENKDNVIVCDIWKNYEILPIYSIAWSVVICCWSSEKTDIIVEYDHIFPVSSKNSLVRRSMIGKTPIFQPLEHGRMMVYMKLGVAIIERDTKDEDISYDKLIQTKLPLKKHIDKYYNALVKIFPKDICNMTMLCTVHKPLESITYEPLKQYEIMEELCKN